jgi:hypothetical protein
VRELVEHEVAARRAALQRRRAVRDDEPHGAGLKDLGDRRVAVGEAGGVPAAERRVPRDEADQPLRIAGRGSHRCAHAARVAMAHARPRGMGERPGRGGAPGQQGHEEQAERGDAPHAPVVTHL